MESPTGVDWATLILAGIAAAGAIAAVPVAVWAWIDRPRYGWHFHTTRDGVQAVPIAGGTALMINDRTRAHKVQILVYAVGTATVINVSLRFVGCQPIGSDNDLLSPRIERGAEPLRATVVVPAVESGDAWAEVVWERIRPHRQFGIRINLRTEEVQSWRWSWLPTPTWQRTRRLRLRFERGGRWSRHGRRVTPSLPAPDDA